MKLLSGLFDMLANKSDTDASNLIEGLAKDMKELKEKMADMPELKNLQAYGAKNGSVPGRENGRTSAGDSGRARNTVSPNYQTADSVIRPNVSEEKPFFGVSWGDEMPKEPNQFNSHMPYDKYFREVFREAFPDYEIVEEDGGCSRPATVFTFWKGDDRALVVEVISQSTAVVKRRNQCRRTGTPYLRYYYDHAGWWNTKQYVIERTRHALGG